MAFLCLNTSPQHVAHNLWLRKKRCIPGRKRNTSNGVSDCSQLRWMTTFRARLLSISGISFSACLLWCVSQGAIANAMFIQARSKGTVDLEWFLRSPSCGSISAILFSVVTTRFFLLLSRRTEPTSIGLARWMCNTMSLQVSHLAIFSPSASEQILMSLRLRGSSSIQSHAGKGIGQFRLDKRATRNLDQRQALRRTAHSTDHRVGQHGSQSLIVL